MPTRRDLLHLGAALPLLAAMPGRAVRADAIPALSARPFETAFAPDLPPTRLWGFDAGRGASMPGPVLRGRQGETLARRVRNDLPEPTSIHWHGLRLPNEMDGVPGLTSPLVEPGASQDVALDLRDAGTFWYHSHQRGFEQVERGLYGALIVDEAEGAPDIDVDAVLVLDDIRLDRDLQLAAFGGAHDHSHAGRIGNVPLVNGRPRASFETNAGARLRLRLIGAQTARIFRLRLDGLEAWIVAIDGQPLDQPESMTDDLVLGPGQRIDLLVDVTAVSGGEAHLVSMERDGGYALATFSATGPARARRPAPGALPPNPGWILPDLSYATPVAVPLEGGAMGRMDGATFGDETLGFRALARQGAFWAMSGRADMGETPLATVKVGQTVRLDIDNATTWPHAMHLHGTHFREILADGAFGPLRDTLLMAGRSRGSVAFVAESPGDWLFHCHMLGHAASGMTTWLRVV